MYLNMMFVDLESAIHSMMASVVDAGYVDFLNDAIVATVGGMLETDYFQPGMELVNVMESALAESALAEKSHV